MQKAFFANAKTVGLVRSGPQGAGPCEKAANQDLAKFLGSADLSKISNLELKAAELTDREVDVTWETLYWEIKAKLQRYSNMYSNESGDPTRREFGIDSAALTSLFQKTSGYNRKTEVFQKLAARLKEDTDKYDEAFFGDYQKPTKSEGVWVRHPRAPLEQEGMSTPLDVLCGIKRLDSKQPHFLVRAGALAALGRCCRSRRKRIVVQRVGETLCVANAKYDGPLNMNSQGLQLERVLCGQPQYLDPGTLGFKEYSTKQVFVLKEIEFPSKKVLCTYYHAFGQSTDKKTKGRVQVDSSEQPENYRLKSGASVKDTAIQMWARGQRYLHHTRWDRKREYLIVALPVRELTPEGTGGPPAAGNVEEAVAEPWVDPEDETRNAPFEEGWIRVRVQNNNKVVSRPLGLDECLPFEAVAAQAFPTEAEAAAVQQLIMSNLEHINKALNEKESSDGTEEKWYSYAYYLNRLKLQNGYDADDLDIFDEAWSVSFADRLMPKDGLAYYKRIVHGVQQR